MGWIDTFTFIMWWWTRSNRTMSHRTQCGYQCSGMLQIQLIGAEVSPLIRKKIKNREAHKNLKRHCYKIKSITSFE